VEGIVSFTGPVYGVNDKFGTPLSVAFLSITYLLPLGPAAYSPANTAPVFV
jgi:hypothetical protein